MPKRLRIAQIVGNLETGGTQSLLIEMMRRLDRDRFDPILIHFKSPNHFEDEVRDKGWECYKVKASRSYRMREIRNLASALIEYKVDFVHTHSDFANFAGRAAAVYARVPHILVHYQNTYEHRIDEQFRRLEAQLAARTDGFIACSKGVEDFLAKNLDLKGRPVHLMPNCVNVEPYFEAAADRAAARKKLAVPQDVFHLVHTARLEPHKQPQQLLKALSLSTQKPENSLGDWRLTLVGGGSMREELEHHLKKIDDLAVSAGGEAIAPRVHFAGWSKDIATWLATADVFCLVSKNEGLPLSLVEAMAAGAPTVASNIIGPQEVLLENEYGLLVDSNRPDDILRALLAYRSDEEMRQKMIEKGKGRAREYSVVRYVEKLEKLYEEMALQPGLSQTNPISFLGKMKLIAELRHTAKRFRRTQKRTELR